MQFLDINQKLHLLQSSAYMRAILFCPFFSSSLNAIQIRLKLLIFFSSFEFFFICPKIKFVLLLCCDCTLKALKCLTDDHYFVCTSVCACVLTSVCITYYQSRFIFPVTNANANNKNICLLWIYFYRNDHFCLFVTCFEYHLYNREKHISEFVLY